jgi:4-diphosphocytidyl-2-C-methyl-D-erythritol kinase
MATKVRSHAKINLGLGIGAPRPDGFHSLCTVYQTLELHDVVTVEARLAAATAIRITSNDERVPANERNTAWKMVVLGLQVLQLRAAVHIHIEKELPVQGGLGAGSANAVAALVGLEKELQVPFRSLFTQRLAIAAQVGSDVPLFLIGGTVLGLDRGQEVYPLPDLEPVWCVVAAPEVGVSTPQAFKDWDALCVREGLTQEASAAKLQKLSRAYASAFSGRQGSGSSGVLSDGEDLAGPQETTQGSGLVRTGITSWTENDFERVVFPQQPILCDIKRLLAGTGTPEGAHPYSSLVASLSGSGSALYGLYATRGDAEAAQAQLTEKKVRSMLTRTIPRSAYWSEMLL